MQFSIVKLVIWRVIHWVPYLYVKFIVHGSLPLRLSKTPQIAHVFVCGWWPNEPMFVCFSDHCSRTKCDHGTEDRCAQHRFRSGTGPCCQVNDSEFSESTEQIKGCNAQQVQRSNSPVQIEFMMWSWLSWTNTFCLKYHQKQHSIGQRPQFG